VKLEGSFSPPGDKSLSHRLALLAVLARGECRVENFAPGADCASSLEALAALGGGVERRQEAVRLRGLAGEVAPQAALDCGNSGTTMRLLMGVLAGRKGRWRLKGDASLSRRPMERVAAPLREMGARVATHRGRPPVEIIGSGLQGREHHLAVASAQVKSALLLAGLQAEGTTTVREPAPSRDHTERLLAAMGADLERRPDGAWQVRRSQLTLPERWRVPGDPSSAAFLLCAAAVLPGSRVTARGVLLNPTRTGFLTVLRRMGAAVEVAVEGEEPEPWGRVSVRQGPPLVACTVEAELFPSLVDEVPILALVATQAKGTTCFRGVGELRHKESDRLAMVVNQLRRMGARLAVEGEDLYVDGPTPLAAPRRLESAGDHRMAMMLRLAGLVAGAWPEVADEGCCAVSWPGFGRTLEALLA